MKISVIRSAVIDAPIDQVWGVLRNFDGMESWHPAVSACRMENDVGGDVVGGVRVLNLADGIELREQLLRHSDLEYTFSCCILDASVPLFDYTATVRLKPVTDGNRTLWDWRARFRAPADRATELENMVGRQIYEAGFTGLRKFLAGETASPPSPPPSHEEPTESASTVGSGDLISRAVVVSATGDPEVMSLSEVTVPAPGPEQVRLRQTVIAINYEDIKHRRGISEGLDLPGTPGLEGVGEVIDVGKQVNGIFPGDRIAYMSRTPGAYAAIYCIDADACIPLAPGISDNEASTLLKGVTAGLLLSRVFRAAPNATILIQSVSGGVGHLLSQWAKSMNLTVIGTASTIEKAKFSRDHGCDYPIVVDDDSKLPAEVMRITRGRGVDYWVHSSGARGLDTAFACLAGCGHCAVIGDRDGESVSLNVNVLKDRSLTVSAPVCFDYFSDRTYMQRLAHHLFSKIQSRAIVPAIESYPLSQAAEAHHRIEDRRNMGAVVLTPER